MSKTVVMTDTANDIVRKFTANTEQTAWDKVIDWWPEFVNWHQPSRTPERDEYEWEVVTTCAKGHGEHYLRYSGKKTHCRKCNAILREAYRQKNKK